MQTITLMSAVVVVVVVLLFSPPSADAVCCYENNSGYCGDCTLSTPYCGYGRCNIFGCNCDGGCRRGGCFKKRSIDEQISDVHSIVKSGDLNGDGLLSVEEAETMLEQGPNAGHRRSVRSLDKNNDGVLTVDEIDS